MFDRTAKRTGFLTWLVIAALGVTLAGVAALAAPAQALASNWHEDVQSFQVSPAGDKNADSMVWSEEAEIEVEASVAGEIDGQWTDYTDQCIVTWELNGDGNRIALSTDKTTANNSVTLTVKDDVSHDEKFSFFLIATLSYNNQTLADEWYYMEVTDEYYDVRFTQEEIEHFRSTLPTQTTTCTPTLWHVTEGESGAVEEQVDIGILEAAPFDDASSVESIHQNSVITIKRLQNEETSVWVTAYAKGDAQSEDTPSASASFAAPRADIELRLNQESDTAFTNVDHAIDVTLSQFQGTEEDPNKFWYDTTYFRMGYWIGGYDEAGKQIIGTTTDGDEFNPAQETYLYAYDAAGDSISMGTLSAFSNGKATLNLSTDGLKNLYANGVRSIDVVMVVVDNNGNRLMVNEDGWAVNVRLEEPTYSVVNDGTFFPGDSFWLGKDTNAYVQDTYHPYGDDIKATVTTAIIEPADQRICGLDEEDDGWKMTARNPGEMTAKVTYELDDSACNEENENHYAGKSFTDEVTLTVLTQRWEANMSFSDGTDRMLPHSEKTVVPSVCFKRYNASDKVYPADLPDVELKWELADNDASDYVSIEQQDDGSVVVTSKDLKEDESEHWVNLRLTVWEPNDAGEMVQVAAEERGICVSYGYIVLMASADEALSDIYAECANGTVTNPVAASAKVMLYSLGENGDLQSSDISSSYDITFYEDEFGGRSDRNLLKTNEDGTVVLNDGNFVFEEDIDTSDLSWSARIRVAATPKESAPENYGSCEADYNVVLCSGHSWKYTAAVDESHDTFTCENCDCTKVDAKHTCVCRDSVTKLANTSEPGIMTHVCKTCGKMTSELIASPKTVTLSYTKTTYTGKALKPTVTVKDSKGKVINAKYYTVKYTNNTNVGKATVTVTFTGAISAKSGISKVTNPYTGKLTTTFTINPKGTTVSSVTAASKAFTAKWKKQATQTTGYQIRYSTSSSMASAKTVTISKNTTVSKKVSSLKAKKTYYVQVRTYKTVSGTKYYSAWSASKKVTTKK